jgi:LEA14-like dessication related protein
VAETMMVSRLALKFLALIATLALAACAGLPGQDPLQVTVAGIDSLPGEGLELRMMVKLRVQNPNDTSVEYDGVYVKLDVLDKTFGTGVTNERGVVPRYGESVISVPVTVSSLRVAIHGIGYMLDGRSTDKIRYKLEGKLDGPAFGSSRFRTEGEFALPSPETRPH